MITALHFSRVENKATELNPKNALMTFLAVFLLSSCATANIYQSQKTTSVSYHLEHIHVLYVEPKFYDLENNFNEKYMSQQDHQSKWEHPRLADYSLEKIPEAFKKNGISSHIIKIEGTLKQSISADLHKRFSDQYEGPILIVKPVATSVRKHSHWRTTFKVKVELLDTSTKTPTTAWWAVIVPTAPSFTVLPRLGEAEEMARALVEKMKSDKVIE